MTPGISILERLSSRLIHNFFKLNNVGFLIGNTKYRKLVSVRELKINKFKQVIHESFAPTDVQVRIFTNN